MKFLLLILLLPLSAISQSKPSLQYCEPQDFYYKKYEVNSDGGINGYFKLIHNQSGYELKDIIDYKIAILRNNDRVIFIRECQVYFLLHEFVAIPINEAMSVERLASTSAVFIKTGEKNLDIIDDGNYVSDLISLKSQSSGSKSYIVMKSNSNGRIYNIDYDWFISAKYNYPIPIFGN